MRHLEEMKIAGLAMALCIVMLVIYVVVPKDGTASHLTAIPDNNAAEPVSDSTSQGSVDDGDDNSGDFPIYTEDSYNSDQDSYDNSDSSYDPGTDSDNTSYDDSTTDDSDNSQDDNTDDSGDSSDPVDVIDDSSDNGDASDTDLDNSGGEDTSDDTVDVY